MKICVAFFAINIVLFIGGCGGKTDPTFNIAGSWYIFHTTDVAKGEQGPDLFAFAQTDNDLTGTAPTGESITGSVSGLDVSFSWTTSVGGTNVTKNYSGEVSTDGTTISGTWSDSSNNRGTWNAIIKLNPLGNIQGVWNLTEPAGGVGGVQGFSFIQAQSGNDLAGSQTAQGDVEAITGIVTNPDIMFFWLGSDGTLYMFTGILNNVNNGVASEMSGTWTATNGQSGSWSATRSKNN